MNKKYYQKYVHGEYEQKKIYIVAMDFGIKWGDDKNT